jgi:hypothetical protein
MKRRFATYQRALRPYLTGLLLTGLLVTGCGTTSTPEGAATDTDSAALATPPTSSATATSPTPSVTAVTPPAPKKIPRHKSAPKPAPPKRPATHRPVHHPTAHRTTQDPPTAGNVHPGAFCTPAGAYGHTSSGTLMQCKGPGQPRWRRA